MVYILEGGLARFVTSAVAHSKSSLRRSMPDNASVPCPAVRIVIRDRLSEVVIEGALVIQWRCVIMEERLWNAWF